MEGLHISTTRGKLEEIHSLKRTRLDGTVSRGKDRNIVFYWCWDPEDIIHNSTCKRNMPHVTHKHHGRSILHFYVQKVFALKQHHSQFRSWFMKTTFGLRIDSQKSDSGLWGDAQSWLTSFWRHTHPYPSISMESFMHPNSGIVDVPSPHFHWLFTYTPHWTFGRLRSREHGALNHRRERERQRERTVEWWDRAEGAAANDHSPSW